MNQADFIVSDNTDTTSLNRPVVEDKTLLYQTPAYLLRLMHQAERLEQQINVLLGEVKQNNIQLDVLTRHATEATATRMIEERLAEMLTQLEGHEEQLNNLTNTVKLLSQLESHEEQLKNVAKTVKKLSRTNFKANTLNESQQQRMQEALSTLRELATRRDEAAEVDGREEEQRLTKAGLQARREMAAELLPALDGVENALDSGRALLVRRQQKSAQIEAEVDAQIQAEEHTQEPTSIKKYSLQSNPSFWERLDYAFGGQLREKQKPQMIYKTVKVKVPMPNDEPLAAWLDGLELVRERFLSLLLHEEIEAIPALNQPFDPRLHIAIEAVERDNVPPGTVVKVVRKGYRQNKRILRYAEVVVSKAVEDV